MGHMEPFDPTSFNFVLLRDFEIPGGVKVYEHRSHVVVDGTRDYLRLNFYLTKDASYVTIWRGLLEPVGTEMELTTGRLAAVERPDDLSFLRDSYNEDLFRGHIETAEAATCILQALRIGTPGHYRAAPQVLTKGPDNDLRCEILHEAIT